MKDLHSLPRLVLASWRSAKYNHRIMLECPAIDEEGELHNVADGLGYDPLNSGWTKSWCDPYYKSDYFTEGLESLCRKTFSPEAVEVARNPPRIRTEMYPWHCTRKQHNDPTMINIQSTSSLEKFLADLEIIDQMMQSQSILLASSADEVLNKWNRYKKEAHDDALRLYEDAGMPETESEFNELKRRNGLARHWRKIRYLEDDLIGLVEAGLNPTPEEIKQRAKAAKEKRIEEMREGFRQSNEAKKFKQAMKNSAAANENSAFLSGMI